MATDRKADGLKRRPLFSFMEVHKMKILKLHMEELVAFIEAQLKREEVLNAADIHWTVCHETADHFRLYDRETRFPLWLSYVVAGILREMNIDN